MNNKRNKGWRKEISKNKKSKKRSDKKKDNLFIEKNWKMLYLRSEKLRRAKQLGINYPRKSPLNIYLDEELEDNSETKDIGL